MRKVFCVVLSALLCVALFAACGEGKPASSVVSTPSSMATIPPTPTAPPQMVKVAVVKGAESGLNVRADDSTDAEVLGTAENGDKFILLVAEAQNGWYRIKFGTRDAFISSEYAEIQEITKTEADSLDSDSSSSTETTPTPNPTSGDTSGTDAGVTSSAPSGNESTPYNASDEDGET